MFRLNKDLYNNCSVNVLNIPPDIEQKIIYQLSPFIIYQDGESENKIILNKADFDSTFLFNNDLIINYSNELYLLMALRQSIREFLYNSYLNDSYIKMHCSAVEKDNKVYVFMGGNCTGKTSTALGLCKYCGYSLINGDLSLIKEKQLIGWSTSIGTREYTTKKLGIPDSPDPKYNNLNWLWQEDYRRLGYIFSSGGIIDKIIFVNYDFNSVYEVFNKIDNDKKLELLNKNIHFDEICKKSYWNVNQDKNMPVIDEKNDIMNVSAFDYVSNGLDEKNIKKLSRHLEEIK